MKLTEHFTLNEFTRSATATRLNIDNTPNEEEQGNLLLLCQTILEPLRKAYNKPIKVSSGFRCVELNKAVKGAKNSQHIKGEAADIQGTSIEENKKIFELAKKLMNDKVIKVGQLIDEYNYKWVHISLPTPTKQNQILHLK